MGTASAPEAEDGDEDKGIGGGGGGGGGGAAAPEAVDERGAFLRLLEEPVKKGGEKVHS